MATRNVNIVVKARDEASRELLSIGSATDKLGSSLRKAAIAGAALFGAVSASRLARDALRRAIEQEAAERKLQQALVATGHAARISFDDMANYATALSEVTTFTDDMIITGESILAKFKEVKGEVFKETTELALDLATALGKTSNVIPIFIQLGKALNDPVKGVTALTAAGISFTQQQREQIKVLVESNNILDAQRIITKSLTDQIGGQARAAAEGAGVFIQMRNEINELKEEIASAFLPVLISSGEKIRDWARDNRIAVRDFARRAAIEMTFVEDVIGEIAEFMRNDFTGSLQFGLDASLIVVKAWGQELEVIIRKIMETVETEMAVSIKKMTLKLTDIGPDLAAGIKMAIAGARGDQEEMLKISREVLDRENVRESRDKIREKFFSDRVTTPWTQVVMDIKEIHAKAMKELVEKTPPAFRKGIEDALAKREASIAALLAGGRGGLPLPPDMGRPGGGGTIDEIVASITGRRRQQLRPTEGRFLGRAPSAPRRQPIDKIAENTAKMVRWLERLHAATQKEININRRSLGKEPLILASDFR